MAEQIPKLREERAQIMKDGRDVVISQVTVEQAIGGMRGIKGMVCDTSLVEPDTGLVIRGIPNSACGRLSSARRARFLAVVACFRGCWMA